MPGVPVSQVPLLQPAQISPTSAAAAQYPAPLAADYTAAAAAAAAAAYGYPGLTGLEYSQASAITAPYALAHPSCFYSMPPTTPIGMQYQPIPAEARLQ